MLPHASSSSMPEATLSTSWPAYGTKTSASRSMTPPITPRATAHTIAAAAARERPRARSRTANGAKAAAMTIAMAMDAETVHMSVASIHRTTRSAPMTMIRQPSAARLASQPGMISGRRAGARAVIREARGQGSDSAPGARRRRSPSTGCASLDARASVSCR